MSQLLPAFWWPIERRASANAAQNCYVEILLRTGSGPYTYYGTTDGFTPTSGASEPAYGYICLLPTPATALQYPYGYIAWKHIYEYCEAISAVLLAKSGLPSGLALEWDVSAEGVLSLAVSSSTAGTAVKFVWTAAGSSPASTYLPAQALLGFEDTALYQATITGSTGHGHGFYLGSAGGAGLTEDSGYITSAVAVFESFSIYGQAATAALGGRTTRSIGLRYIDASQLDRLREFWSYAVEGGLFSYFPDGPIWADMALSHSLLAESRGAFKVKRVSPGVPRYDADLQLVLRG